MSGKQIKCVIPGDISEKYNWAFTKIKPSNVLIGYEKQLKSLADTMAQPAGQIALLVGPQGVGKTETVSKYAYDSIDSEKPAVIIRLDIGILGELESNLMVSRLGTLSKDFRYIEYYTLLENFPYDSIRKKDVTGMPDKEIEDLMERGSRAVLAVYDSLKLKRNRVNIQGLRPEAVDTLIEKNDVIRHKEDILVIDKEKVDLTSLSDTQIDILLKQNPLAIRYQRDFLDIADKTFKLDVKWLRREDVAVLVDANKDILERASQYIIYNDNYYLILFVDEIHLLNNYGEKANGLQGSSGAMNALKESFGRGEIRFIGATTEYEYRDNIAGDGAFDRRLDKITFTQPDDEQAFEIIKRHLDVWAKHSENKIEVSDDILKEVIYYTNNLITEQIQPAKSIAILNSAWGVAVNEGVSVINKSHIKQAFAKLNYNLDINIDAKTVERELVKRVKGQPLAIRTLVGTVRRSKYTKRDFKKPILSALLVGTTGVGKTESVKALGKAIYGREDSILTINGGDYLTPEAVTEATRFIADNVQTNRSRIILLDEIEKAHKDMAKACMRMIDEGIVKDSKNMERSLSSCIIIATSNLGAGVIAKASETIKLDEVESPDKISPKIEEGWRGQSMNIQTALATGNEGQNNGLPPEFLQRFSIVPYFALQKKSYAVIASLKLKKFVQEESELGYDVRIPAKYSKAEWKKIGLNYDDVDIVSVMIAEDIINTDASMVGARSINQYIENVIKNKVSMAIEYRLDAGLDMDGFFAIDSNGHSLAEDTSVDEASTIVTYNDSTGVWVVDEYHYERDGITPLYLNVTGLDKAQIWDAIISDDKPNGVLKRNTKPVWMF